MVMFLASLIWVPTNQPRPMKDVFIVLSNFLMDVLMELVVMDKANRVFTSIYMTDIYQIQSVKMFVGRESVLAE